MQGNIGDTGLRLRKGKLLHHRDRTGQYLYGFKVGEPQAQKKWVGHENVSDKSFPCLLYEEEPDPITAERVLLVS